MYRRYCTCRRGGDSTLPPSPDPLSRSPFSVALNSFARRLSVVANAPITHARGNRQGLGNGREERGSENKKREGKENGDKSSSVGNGSQPDGSSQRLMIVRPDGWQTRNAEAGATGVESVRILAGRGRVWSGLK